MATLSYLNYIASLSTLFMERPRVAHLTPELSDLCSHAQRALLNMSVAEPSDIRPPYCLIQRDATIKEATSIIILAWLELNLRGNSGKDIEEYGAGVVPDPGLLVLVRRLLNV